MKTTPKRRTSERKKRSAVERINRGESTVEEEARKLRVSTFAVRHWRTRFANLDHGGSQLSGRMPSERSDGDGEDSEVRGRVDPGSRGEDERLDRALDSAGIGDEQTNGASPDAEGVPSEPIPAPDPKAMVSLAAVVREQLLRLVAGVMGLDVSDARVREICELSKESREALEAWAPYVAQRFPTMASESEDLPIYMFAGILGSSCINAGFEFWRMKRHAEKPVVPQEPGRVRTMDIQAQGRAE